MLFGFVFQDHYLHPNLNVDYNIKTPLLTQSRTVSRDSLINAGKALDIRDTLPKYYNEISGGQAQRASILRALTKQSPVLFGDELTSNIDHLRARKILNEISRLVQDPASGSSCFIWVSHDIPLIKSYAGKIITIRDGRIDCVDNRFQTYSQIIRHLQKPHDQSELKAPGKSAQDGNNMGVAKAIPPAQSFNKQVDNPIPDPGPFHFPSRPADLAERIRYYLSYAYRDLFRHTWRPTVDFTMVVLSMTFVTLFLLSILKISYGSNRFLEEQLSDPRINSFEVSANETIGGELSEKHFERLKEALGNNVRYITPVFYVRTSLKHLSRNKFKSIGNALTFRGDDPILREILPGKPPAFATSPDQFKGIIMQREAAEKFGYTQKDRAATVKFNGFNTRGNEEVPLYLVDTPLPFSKSMMIREEFYLDGYKNRPNIPKPYIAYIVVYPRTIYQSMAIKKTIESLGIFDINDAFKVLNKLRLLDEIKKQTGIFVVLSLWAIAIISVLFIAVTIYRNLHKKRREIGVFLAYGMQRSSFYIFYLCETIIINLVTLGLSLGIYLLVIEPMINRMLARGSLMKVIGAVNLDTQVGLEALKLPLPWVAGIYVSAFLILTLLFVCLIGNFIRQKPIALMRSL